jgi:hypothetical protein
MKKNKSSIKILADTIMNKFYVSLILFFLAVGCTNDPVCIEDAAAFSYSSESSYLNTTSCRWDGSVNSPNPVPEFPGASKAGTFTSDPEGVVFVNNSAGEIDLLASSPGVYTITNTLNDECGIQTHSTTFEVLPLFTVEEVVLNGLVTMYYYRLKDVATNPELKDDMKYDIHWYHITSAGEIKERTDISGAPWETFGLSDFGHFITPDPQTGTTRNMDALVVEITNLMTNCVTRRHFGKPLSELPEPGRSF